MFFSQLMHDGEALVSGCKWTALGGDVQVPAWRGEVRACGGLALEDVHPLPTGGVIDLENHRIDQMELLSPAKADRGGRLA